MVVCNERTEDGKCAVVARLGAAAIPSEKACLQCSVSSVPRGVNRVTCGIAFVSLRRAGGEIPNEVLATLGIHGKRAISSGLGDWTEQQLKSIGVTQERYKAAKELFGLSPTCDCEGRKQWLNSVSDWWRGK